MYDDHFEKGITFRHCIKHLPMIRLEEICLADYTNMQSPGNIIRL